jgi:hypothetical protein
MKMRIPCCYVYGSSNFYPSKIKFKEKIICTANDPGDIGNIGKYKNKKIPYGYLAFEVPKQINEENKLNVMLKLIKKYKNEFIQNGAKSIVLHIVWVGIQGNMEFNTKELKSIAELEIPLTITYVYNKDWN